MKSNPLFRRCTLTMAALSMIVGFVGGVEGEPLEVSGVYPHLAMFNDGNECGIGAVVPWAGRLWVTTYAPHQPLGSDDKLYEITSELEQIIRPESIGGTPANRMIHRESGQLFIASYAIDEERNVRVIPFSEMPGRHTGNARHLIDPAGKIYYATMEEGFHEVDVDTLAVTTLYTDNQEQLRDPDAVAPEGKPPYADLPGYHGKGLYSGQGRLVYANNGEPSGEARRRPDIPSGCLAEWDGREWKVIQRNQFTEVTGPGGIYGNEDPETDPIWSVGWDHRSLLLMVLDEGVWHRYRLPKGSHSYDGAHGWNTEWPRIREIGEEDFLMTMHGTFWSFPPTFTSTSSAGVRPRSNYLRVIGDFARWEDRVVFGCDDTAKSEFLNKRRAKGSIAPGQSQSNLWFVDPAELDGFGPVIGRGGPWMEDTLDAGTYSDPYLFDGYEMRMLHLHHGGEELLTVEMEVDKNGTGEWVSLRSVSVPSASGVQVYFDDSERGAWIRLRVHENANRLSAVFHYRNGDRRPNRNDALFEGIMEAGDGVGSGGIIRPRGENRRDLHFAALVAGEGGGAEDLGYYRLDEKLELKKTEDESSHEWLKDSAKIVPDAVEIDEASVIYIDEGGQRFRLPFGSSESAESGPMGPTRVVREVCTERDLFTAGGIVYELPAENAGGFALVRPVATHNLRIHDFCSYRGLVIMSGIRNDASTTGNSRIIRSDDGKTALWAGVVDDLWKMGKSRGEGGPWKNSKVGAGEPSDPYLMTGFDKKSMVLTNHGPEATEVLVEIEIAGSGIWVPYKRFSMAPDSTESYAFPEFLAAYWIRFTSMRDTTATAWLRYE